ncbi:MAG: GNAT family N-acetyltransferase [candidate division Zixibacteria bacterium]|nr:GNAT family N-acetyltransferase [candidate division Zixibacteria bacterium]
MKKIGNIRPAKAGDLQDVKTLLSECDLPIDGLEQQFDSSYCVAEHHGEIVGVGGVEVYNPYGLLRSVAVSPAWQGKSIGEAVIKDRLAWAKSKGLSAVFLLTTTAAEYFERFGFRPIDRDAVPSEIRKSSEFCSLCPQSATGMVKSLCDSTSNP